MRISDKIIGENQPVFIIAELSANHARNFKVALQTIKAAKDAGADAIKLQTYKPDSITLNVDNELFRLKKGSLHYGKTLYQVYQEAYTPWEWQPKLKEVAEDLGLICFSSPFDTAAVDYLEAMRVPAYKVASLEITDIPLIEYIASKGKPILISTGIATIAEIKEAIKVCKQKGNDQLALLKCTSAYPTPFNEVNLKAIPYLADTFHTVIGLSDHTLGISVPIAAVALGARIIEKHFILDRNLGGVDSKFSLEPKEFKDMVEAIRQVELALGEREYTLSNIAKKSRDYRRSLFVVKDIQKGGKLTSDNVRSIRPGDGLPPKYFNEILGKKANNFIPKGTPLDWDLIK